jgi:YegS/Rv2252/BmrU family lipid kinase
MANQLRHKVIFNPAAARGKAGGRVPEVERLLRNYGVRYELVRTERPLHAVELAARAGAEGFDVAVAAGGDGTANEVLNGLMRVREGGAKPPALGLLCIGRGNDFAYGAGVPVGLAEGCALLARGERRWMDVGRFRGGDFPQGRYFGNGIGVGFDTIVGLEAAKMKWAHGFLGYVVGALKTMFLYYRAPLLAITFGGNTREQRSLQISAMNGRRMGGTFYMTPEALNDDGQLDLCIAGEPRRLQMLGLILKYMKGTQAGSPHIRMGRSPVLEVRALEGGLAVHADGETMGVQVEGLTVECLPRQVEVVSAGPP